MPWKALDFKDRAKKDEISQKFKITGIPTLVLLEADSGNVVTMNGRSDIMSYEFDDLKNLAKK
jgi:nucleoredoxin